MLVGPADAKVVDGVQSERIKPGRDVALGSHGGRVEESGDGECSGKRVYRLPRAPWTAMRVWRLRDGDAQNPEVLAPRKWMTKRFWFGLEVELNCHLRAFVLHGLV